MNEAPRQAKNIEYSDAEIKEAKQIYAAMLFVGLTALVAGAIIIKTNF